MEDNIFGYNLKILRKNHKITQEKLAEIINVTPKTIQNWEHGKYAPSREACKLLCSFFGMTLSDMYDIALEDKLVSESLRTTDPIKTEIDRSISTTSANDTISPQLDQSYTDKVTLCESFNQPSYTANDNNTEKNHPISYINAIVRLILYTIKDIVMLTGAWVAMIIVCLRPHILLSSIAVILICYCMGTVIGTYRYPHSRPWGKILCVVYGIVVYAGSALASIYVISTIITFAIFGS